MSFLQTHRTLKAKTHPYNSQRFNPFQSNFSANRILPSPYLLWAGKRLMDYLLAKVRTTREKVLDRLLQRSGRTNAKKNVSDRLLQRSRLTNAKKKVSDVTRHRSRMGKSQCRTRSDVGSERVKIMTIKNTQKNKLMTQMCSTEVWLMIVTARVSMSKS